jgi:hypothetical protein
MVLRGAQFQGSGPARCKFPTRQAPSSCRPAFVHRQSDADCLPQGRRMTHSHLMHSHGRGQCWQPHKSTGEPHDALVLARSSWAQACVGFYGLEGGIRRNGCAHTHSLDDLNLNEGRKRWDRQRRS